MRERTIKRMALFLMSICLAIGGLIYLGYLYEVRQPGIIIDQAGIAYSIDTNSSNNLLDQYGISILRINIPNHLIFTQKDERGAQSAYASTLTNFSYYTGKSFDVNSKNCSIETAVQVNAPPDSFFFLPSFSLSFISSQLKCKGAQRPLIINIPTVQTGLPSYKKVQNGLVIQNNLDIYGYVYDSKIQTQILTNTQS